MEIKYKEGILQFKDVIGPREADKIGFCMPSTPDEDVDVFMARFYRRFVKHMLIKGEIKLSVANLIWVASQPEIVKLVKEYLGDE